jgi:hypothetical protein
MNNDLIEVKITVVLAIIAFVCYCVFAPIQCSARWRGKETSWGPIQGCLVKKQSGECVPDDRLRDVAP